MPKLKEKLPKYCRFSGRDVAYFCLNGQRVFLPGGFNSPESLEAYHREMAALSQERAENKSSFPSTSHINLCGSSGKQQQTAHRKINQLSVNELVEMFLDWGKPHYLKNGKPSETIKDFDKSCKVLLDLYGHVSVDEFSQRELITVQEILVSNGLARKTINDYLRRQKRIFNWAAGRGTVPNNHHPHVR